MIHAHLTPEQLQHAIDVASRRHERSKRMGDGHGERNRTYLQRLENHITGAIGEAIVCAWKGVPYEPDETAFARGDLAEVFGYPIEIRSLEGDYHRPHLTIFPNDAAAKPCVLVSFVRGTDIITSSKETVHGTIWGWIYAGAPNVRTPFNRQKAVEKCREGSPQQWWVPCTSLRHMSELPEADDYYEKCKAAGIPVEARP